MVVLHLYLVTLWVLSYFVSKFRFSLQLLLVILLLFVSFLSKYTCSPSDLCSLIVLCLNLIHLHLCCFLAECRNVDLKINWLHFGLMDELIRWHACKLQLDLLVVTVVCLRECFVCLDRRQTTCCWLLSLIHVANKPASEGNRLSLWTWFIRAGFGCSLLSVLSFSFF